MLYSNLKKYFFSLGISIVLIDIYSLSRNIWALSPRFTSLCFRNKLGSREESEVTNIFVFSVIAFLLFLSPAEGQIFIIAGNTSTLNLPKWTYLARVCDNTKKSDLGGIEIKSGELTGISIAC